MFSSSERGALREALVEVAHEDDRIIAAALVGSGAREDEDEWSDIDLALRLAPDAQPLSVADTWTETMYADHAAAHHLDLWDGGTLFRVFLLESSLQVDLSFWPTEDFRAVTPSFRLLFGEAAEPAMLPAPSPEHLAGMGWLYALHVRSAIARGRVWQAVHMLDGMRDQAVALACARHRLPAEQGRGVDELSPEFTNALVEARARSVDVDELRRAFMATSTILLSEIARDCPEIAERLSAPVRTLTQAR